MQYEIIRLTDKPEMKECEIEGLVMINYDNTI